MIATVNSQVLAAELRLLNKIVPAKPTIAILSHVLLRAGDEMLEFYATDYDVSLSSSCAAQIALPGECAVPMEKFLALVERFEDGDVEISLDNAQIVIKCKGFTTKLQALPATDFKRPSMVDGEVSTIDASGLRGLIAKTRYAVAAGGSIATLKGALVVLTKNMVGMIASDTKKLAIASMSKGEGTEQKFIIPAKALDMLAADAYEGEVEITASKQHLGFKVGTRQLISRTFEGQFPNYERIIPKSHDKHAKLDRYVLTAALRRVELIDEDKQSVYFTVMNGSMLLSSANSAVGSASESIEADYAGEELKMCLNGTHVLKFLEAATGSSITMSLKSAKQPALFKDGDDHLAVIMAQQP